MPELDTYIVFHGTKILSNIDDDVINKILEAAYKIPEFMEWLKKQPKSIKTKN